MTEEELYKKWRGGAEEFTAQEQKDIEKAFTPSYLVYARPHEPAAFCSHCGKIVVTEKMNTHNRPAICPKCNTECLVHHSWRRSTWPTDTALVYVHRRSADGKGILTRAVVAVREVTATGIDLTTGIDSWFVFHPNGSACYGVHTGRAFPIDCWEHEKVWRKQWSCVRRYLCSQYGYERNIDISGSFDTLRKVAKGTVYGYGLDELLANINEHDLSCEAFVNYFRYRNYPAYEYLLKMGLIKVVVDRLTGHRQGVYSYDPAPDKYLNIRGKTIESIFRCQLTKADKEAMRKNGAMVSECEIREWAEHLRFVSFGDYLDLKCYVRQSFFSTLAEYVQPKRALPYINLHIAKKQITLLSDWLDYLRECRELGRNLEDRRILFPKDIRKAHGETMKQVARLRHAKEMAEADKKKRAFKKRVKAMTKRYDFTAGDYKIVIPEQPSDYITEGENMHNCVGGYVERVTKGITDVVFIRRVDNPESSFGTMEIQNGRIIQARGKYNHDLPPDAQEFVEAFKKQKLEGAA